MIGAHGQLTVLRLSDYKVAQKQRQNQSSMGYPLGRARFTIPLPLQESENE